MLVEQPSVPPPVARAASRWLRARWLILPLLVVLIFALPQLFGGKMKVDSGLYAGVSLHAFNEGTFWTLMAGDTPYFRKPPLVFWIHGLFFRALGPEMWVMRLPSVLAGMGIIALTSMIARRLANRRVALFAGCVMASTISFFHLFQRFVLDYWMTFFILAGVWMVVASLGRGGSQARSRAWLAACAGLPIGLAMLCKPVIAIAALPILAIWLLTIRQNRLAIITLLGGVALALLVAAPWHVSMLALHGDLFRGSYFQREMLERVTTAAGFDREPFYWYVIELARSYWPWMLTLALGVFTWLRMPAHSQREKRFRRFCLVFGVLWFALMSCSADKRIRYLLPEMPMLAMISGWWIAHALRGSPRSRRILRRKVLRGMDIVIPSACAIALVIACLPFTYNTESAPEWDALDDYIRAHPTERYQLGTVNVQDGGRIYFYTGIWPRNRVDPLGRELPMEPGTLVINNHEVPRTARMQGEVVFDQGKLQIIRVR
jgi:4-amino-4-deoxy-L-arabinose transferase-like glycosyltransferase